jgi:Ion channel
LNQPSKRIDLGLFVGLKFQEINSIPLTWMLNYATKPQRQWPSGNAIGKNKGSSDVNTSLGLLRERWSDPLLTMLTVLLILMLFVFAPLQAVGLKIFQVLEFLSAVGIIGGVFLMSGSPAVAVAMLVAVIMAATSAVSRLSAPSVLDIYLFAGALLIMSVALAGVVARTVFSPGPVTYHRIIGAILIYLSVAVVFTALFTMIGLFVPDSFSGMSLEDNPALASKVIYFSFVTLTSTGYGDVFPVHPVARSLCNLETIIGQLYPATLLARLVSLEIEGRR